MSKQEGEIIKQRDESIFHIEQEVADAKSKIGISASVLGGSLAISLFCLGKLLSTEVTSSILIGLSPETTQATFIKLDEISRITIPGTLIANFAAMISLPILIKNHARLVAAESNRYRYLLSSEKQKEEPSAPTSGIE